MSTLTEKKISAALSRCSKQACAIYDKELPRGADEQFWTEVDQIDSMLAGFLREQERMQSSDIDKVFHHFLKKFTALAKQARTRAAQSRARTG